MHGGKLFNVLVLGGAMLGLGCVESAPPAEDAGDSPVADSGPGVAPGADAGDELMECGFCPNDVCCDTDAAGESVTRPGMMCCWGTSC